jgi:hypothetical protein
VDGQQLLCEPRSASSSPGQGERSSGPSRSLALALDEAELDALIRALYVVKDNWWLDPVEEALLVRLETRARP